MCWRRKPRRRSSGETNQRISRGVPGNNETPAVIDLAGRLRRLIRDEVRDEIREELERARQA
jgi:hypothetical protein